MARKSAVNTYVSKLDALDQTVAPAYFLYGEEVYLQDRFLKAIYNFYAKKYKSGWAKYVYHAGDTEAETILNQLVGGSLFAEPKVVVIKEVDELESSGKDALLDSLEHSTPDVTVVLLKESPRVTDKFSKALKKLTEPIPVQIPRVYEMDEWAEYLLDRNDINANAEVRSVLVDLAGESLQTLANELEKIKIYLPEDSREITVDLLRDIVGATRTHSVFEFVDVLGTKSLSKVLEYLFSLLEEGESVSYIVRKAADFYIELWTLKSMLAENYSDKEINRVVFNGRNLTWKYRKFANRFSPREIRQAFPVLEQADVTTKSTGAIEPKNYLTALFVQLMGDQREVIHE